jgi:hypothetical protein
MSRRNLQFVLDRMCNYTFQLASFSFDERPHTDGHPQGISMTHTKRNKKYTIIKKRKKEKFEKKKKKKKKEKEVADFFFDEYCSSVKVCMHDGSAIGRQECDGQRSLSLGTAARMDYYYYYYFFLFFPAF